MLIKKIFSLYFLTFTLITGSFSSLIKTQQSNDSSNGNFKHIVVVTASYNNKNWYKKHLDSFISQDHQNKSMIYIDDCSTDGTGDLVKEYIKTNNLENQITLIQNKTRNGALANQYHTIHSCKDDDIIVILDGDDQLADSQVLSYIHKIYQDPNIWLTYGQFKHLSNNQPGFCTPMPNSIIKNNAFREYHHTPSHLRTFYAKLFKKIKKEDLFYNNDFFTMSCDIAAMFPMIEMASKNHFRFISKILLTYNDLNSINAHKISKTFQRKMDLEIRSRKKYKPLENLFENSPKYKVGLLVVATGKYIQFVEPLIKSADKYFLPEQDVTYFVFTDGKTPPHEKIISVYQKRLGWPYDTMMRYEMYYNAKELLEKMDYLFACDADMLFVDTVGNEILGEQVGTIHPGFYNKRGTYETRACSTAQVKPHEGTYYFAGGFNGGSSQAFLERSKKMTENIYTDLESKVVAVWHDESHLNRYFIDNPPTVILTPSYCYPEQWKLPFHKRLLALDKNHSQIRK